MSADNQQERPNYLMEYRTDGLYFNGRWLKPINEMGEKRFFAEDDSIAVQRANSFIEEMKRLQKGENPRSFTLTGLSRIVYKSREIKERHPISCN